MKKKLLFLCCAFLMWTFVGTALGTTYTFQPNDPGTPDLWDLDHGRAYTWGIDFELAENEQIVGASFFFDNIRNWRTESNDLYLRLLDETTLGATQLRDREYGDYFDGEGIMLNHWEDLPATAQDITYTFDAAEIATLSLYQSLDDNFGFGFDPDCHFYNDGIYFNLETKEIPNGGEVPEPAALLLLGSGLIGFGVFRRKYKKS